MHVGCIGNKLNFKFGVSWPLLDLLQQVTFSPLVSDLSMARPQKRRGLRTAPKRHHLETPFFDVCEKKRNNGKCFGFIDDVTTCRRVSVTGYSNRWSVTSLEKCRLRGMREDREPVTGRYKLKRAYNKENSSKKLFPFKKALCLHVLGTGRTYTHYLSPSQFSFRPQ